MGIAEEDLPLQQAYRWARERGDRMFLNQPFGGGQVRQWTWAQALDESRRIAAYLEAQHWEPGSRVAILSRNCAWWIMADLAIWMAGHVSVPIYSSLRAQSIRQILDHSGAKACFVGAIDDQDAALLNASNISWIAFPNAAAGEGVGWDSLVASNNPIAGDPVRPADDLATIIYTSGTTGNPKGVMHRFAALALNARILTRRLGLGEQERILSYLPLAHIIERIGVEACACLLCSNLFFTEGLETFVQDLQRANSTIFLSVPRLLVKFQQGVFAHLSKARLEMLLRIPAVSRVIKRRILHQLGLDSVRHAACGGAPLSPDILLWYRRLGLPLFEGYGMSETMITHVPLPDSVRPGYVGPALEGVETRLGPDSELQVRSPMTMLGYYRDPQATQAAFTSDGWFRTGDICVIDPDGQTRIVGRTKEQFKTAKGKYVTPAPIETRLMEEPAIDACCLMGSGQPSPLALVVLKDEVRQTCADPQVRHNIEQSLLMRLKKVNAELEPFERLSMIVVADGQWTIANGIVTPTFKLRRNTLESRYESQIDEWRARNTPVVWERASGMTAGAL
jgi:long-chain acyl-CoA synthetase